MVLVKFSFWSHVLLSVGNYPHFFLYFLAFERGVGNASLWSNC